MGFSITVQMFCNQPEQQHEVQYLTVLKVKLHSVEMPEE